MIRGDERFFHEFEVCQKIEKNVIVHKICSETESPHFYYAKEAIFTAICCSYQRIKEAVNAAIGKCMPTHQRSR